MLKPYMNLGLLQCSYIGWVITMMYPAELCSEKFSLAHEGSVVEKKENSTENKQAEVLIPIGC